MLQHKLLKPVTAGTAFVAVLALGMSVVSTTGRAANDNNGAQDEKRMIEIGLAIAASDGIQLNMAGKDPDMVGLGSYLINVSGDCNGCHSSGPEAQYTPQGNPYLLKPPNGPFGGVKKINPATYLGGGFDFGAFPSPGGTVHIVSRNLTPGKSGMPAGDLTLSQFTRILRTGVDLDNAHPNCTLSTNPPITTNCLLGLPPFNPPGVPPFDGSKLQVMPWPAFQNMTDRQIAAMYVFISAIPCLEGGPGQTPGRCN
ncbi:MAG: hypothetical protein HYX27_10710 [Acidobacteria bacterium]|nr:hypothetical protein [Acidobacteriota bacterium]